MATKQPNILILWGDDIGWWNISFNSRGQMGYRTPNIDRIANEGVAFTDYYAQQSCTAGRAAFITGQNPIRTGLTKVGMPGADVGLSAEDPTIAQMLKPLGYVTGQFGKNHLGDKDAHHARLRRVLRQSLSPECGRGARRSGLSKGSCVQETLRSERCAPLPR
jgi:arylsulfatase